MSIRHVWYDIPDVDPGPSCETCARTRGVSIEYSRCPNATEADLAAYAAWQDQLRAGKDNSHGRAHR